MSKKILTDDLILSKMAEDHGVLPLEDLDWNEKLIAIQEHFDFSITSDWGNPDMMFYSETTSDGYEVWVATEDDSKPSINEDIYYYESDWLEKMANAMIDGNSIYFQEYDEDVSNYEFQDVVDEVYEDYFNDKKQDVENELIEEGYELKNEN
tara:strand:+ start:1125 stop:1580 length:456 start_codon:yes stop_codon:yes gene_type:complete